MSDKQVQQPKRWLVPFPEKKALTGHPCQDACNGNMKMGQLLHYFLCEASWELERQDLPESCKVVKFTRSHEHILKRVKISEKSLIQFLKQFTTWEFVLSESYGKEFTIQAEPIRKAMYTPVFTKKVRQKSCTSTSENTTTSDAASEVIESCKVYFLHENPEAIEALQHYNITLEARIQVLSEALKEESCKVVKLQEKVYSLQLYNFTLSTWIDAVSQALKIPSPIDSVRDRDSKERESVVAVAPTSPALSENDNDTHSYSPLAIASSPMTTRNPQEGDSHAAFSPGSADGTAPLPAPVVGSDDHPDDDRRLAASTSTTGMEAGQEEIVPSQGDRDHADPLPPLPATNHLDGGSDDVPSRHNPMDSKSTSGTLDALPVEHTQLREEVGGAGQREDTRRGGSAGNHAHAQGDANGQRLESETPLSSSAVEPGQSAVALPVAPVLPVNDEPHDQDRGEASRHVTVGDIGTPLAPLPQVLPGVSPPTNVPALTVVPQKTRRGKKVGADDAPKVVPRCETREIQRRVNDHRGYALEEDVDIIRERKAIKTWCNLHTLEDYEEVMKRLGKDPYWKKPENYYRIGGVTLLKETARVLSDQGQKKVTPANPNGTVSGLPHFDVPPEWREAMGGR